ncbi:ring-opening amidohydrolase [Stipitochalara longipes BDJ]|nr:ring-opening amidohydrolase [Stipitochalara longipes BDJ]
MASINILKFGVSSPSDTSPLKALKAAGYESDDILAVVGKSEGNGCVNDFSRTLSSHVWLPQIPGSAVTVFSGGTEGVLSPHVTFVVRDRSSTGLQAAVGRTRILQPHEIGTSVHAREVCSSIRSMLNESRIARDQVRLILIKCPLLTSEKVEIIKAAGKTPVTTDTYDSMAKSRYSSALGIAIALDEVEECDLDEALRSQFAWSTKATSVSGHMNDAIDARAITRLLEQVDRDGGHVLQVFAKAEADPTGNIRGNRHTMNTDSDIHSTRHARAAVGGLVAGLIGETRIYVSGGAEGQGPPGGGPICVVYRVGV